ncbi:Uncharacterised protein [Mycobacteroides abscessus subsp. abscessus]|nr:Uncharacterised protein [Mycobacteroides abscessus subsp. abscessus]
MASDATASTQPRLINRPTLRLTVDRSSCKTSPMRAGEQGPILPRAAIRLIWAMLTP